MICQKTITEIAESQLIYCQWNYTPTSHTAPGTLDLVKFMPKFAQIFSKIQLNLKISKMNLIGKQ